MRYLSDVFHKWFERHYKQDAKLSGSIREEEAFKAGFSYAINEIIRWSAWDNSTRMYQLHEKTIEEIFDEPGA